MIDKRFRAQAIYDILVGRHQSYIKGIILEQMALGMGRSKLTEMVPTAGLVSNDNGVSHVMMRR